MALHHRVLPAPYSQPGSWLVGHAIPGMPGAYAIDGDALTEASAAAYARSLNDSACEAFLERLVADLAAPAPDVPPAPVERRATRTKPAAAIPAAAAPTTELRCALWSTGELHLARGEVTVILTPSEARTLVDYCRAWAASVPAAA